MSHIFFNITQVSPSTEETGLAEIMVYELEREPMCPTKKRVLNNEKVNKDVDETNRIEEIKKELVKENQQQQQEEGENGETRNNRKELIDENERFMMRMRRRRTGNGIGAEVEPPKGDGLGSNFGFLVVVCVAVLLVVLFVTLNKKRKIVPRRSAPMNRPVFYRPHTHEF